MFGKQKERIVIIHNHLFKNAGSTIDWVLKNNFGKHFVDHRDDDLMRKGAAYLGPYLIKNKKIKAISTHHLVLPLPVVDNITLPQIVMFRHPIERVLSVYKFEREQKNSSTPGSLNAKKKNLKQYIEWRMQPDVGGTIRNFHISRCLPADRSKNDHLTQEDVLAAKEYVDSVDMLGMVDQFDESMVLFAEYLQSIGLNMNLSYKVQNVGQYRKSNSDSVVEEIHNEIGDDTFNLLMEKNKQDLDLYEYVRQLFDKRKKQAADFQKKLVSYKEMNN